MANTAVAGFQPYNVKNGGSVTFKRGRVLTNNTTAIFMHDAVVRAATGDYVVASATNTAVESSAQGCEYTDAAGTRRMGKYLPAATLYTSSGVDPSNGSYISMVDNVVNTGFRASVANSAIALTDLNLNYVMVLGAGSTTTGLSGHTLNATGRAVTATFPWRVERFIVGDPLNDVDAINVSVICYVNAAFDEPALSASTGA